MSNRGFVAWANAHALEDQALRVRERERALASDLTLAVRRGEMTLEDAEAEQVRRPRLSL